MTKSILIAATFLTSLGFNSSYAQKSDQISNTPPKTEVKFLEDITVEVAPTKVKASGPKAVFADMELVTTKKDKKVSNAKVETPAVSSIESASGLQLKYAILLDTEVETVLNLGLYEVIEDWYGTRYRLGGETKSGIDCSALMQTIFNSFYGIEIPRTAREQYKFSTRVSRTDLKEGDLVFFNTIGGISHVGLYLQNNKFLHASSSGGVMISDLYDDYWLRRFVGVGRIEEIHAEESTSQP